jgi:hypothetical protein
MMPADDVDFSVENILQIDETSESDDIPEMIEEDWDD